MTSRRFVLAALGAALVVPRAARAATPPVYAEDGIAIDWTDPVVYFTAGAPVAGLAQHAVVWHGATWRFASDANRAAFEADPEAYAPQYGGWCAWAVAEGYTASTVPEAWAIVEGRLYLNYSRRVQRQWSRDIPGNIARADSNWSGVLG
jgi:YHS domain-containing protein